MKIIDRYVLVNFLKNYLISFMVLIGMYIALDMVFNFTNLTQTSKDTGQSYSLFRVMYDIGNFYFYQTFVFFVSLSGIIAVVAAAFTLLRLSRFNEMTAMLAAGTPLLRVAMSIIVAGAVMNLVLLPIDQELIIPGMIPKLIRSHQDIHELTRRSYAVHMMQDASGALFNAALYTPPTPGVAAHIQYLDVIERDANYRATRRIYAASAQWDAAKQRWDLVDGHRVAIDSGNRIGADAVEDAAYYKSDINPEAIALNVGKDYAQLLSTAKLNQLIAKPKSYGTLSLSRIKNLRFAQPLVNVVLLLLGISAVLRREPGTIKSSAARCMFLTALCMGGVFVSYQLSASPPTPAWNNTWPALMAWLPIFIFGPLAAYLLDHVKS